LFETSSELAGASGLGLLPGPVERLRAPGLKVPHIGWAPVRWERESRLIEGIESGTPFYFVHSFAPLTAGDDLLGSAEYGERFACAAERGNVFGVQFHPEKSSAAGLRLLANFAGVCASVPA
jgi:glutamine amidotransferase